MTIEITEINGFKNYLYEEERSKNTIEKYVRDLMHFSLWLKDRTLDKSAVLDYKKTLCESFAPKSVNSMLSSLNTYFTYTGQLNFKVKTLKIQRQIFLDDDKELTKEEYNRLLKAAKEKKHDKNKAFTPYERCSTFTLCINAHRNDLRLVYRYSSIKRKRYQVRYTSR